MLAVILGDYVEGGVCIHECGGLTCWGPYPQVLQIVINFNMRGEVGGEFMTYSDEMGGVCIHKRI